MASQLVKKSVVSYKNEGESLFPSQEGPYAGGARPFSRKGPGPKGAEGGIPPFCTSPRCRSVKKMCQWHIFSVGRSGYAARREPWVTVPLLPAGISLFFAVGPAALGGAMVYLPTLYGRPLWSPASIQVPHVFLHGILLDRHASDTLVIPAPFRKGPSSPGRPPPGCQPTHR